MANSPTITANDSGTTYGWNSLETTLTPSTAEMMEIAGVMMPSPSSIEAPITTINVNPAGAIIFPNAGGGDASASSARIPPSPSWSTRMMKVAYLMQTTMTSAQSSRERIPKTSPTPPFESASPRHTLSV